MFQCIFPSLQQIEYNQSLFGHNIQPLGCTRSLNRRKRKILVDMLLIIPPSDQVHFMVSFSLQVYTLPYTPDSADACRNKIAEYYNTPRNLCCSKCAPGKG